MRRHARNAFSMFAIVAAFTLTILVPEPASAAPIGCQASVVKYRVANGLTDPVVSTGSNAAGCWEAHARYGIYSSASGTFRVTEPLLAKYRALGGASSYGWPKAEQAPTPFYAGGTSQDFARYDSKPAAVFSSPQTGARELNSGVLATYRTSTVYSQAEIGLPTSDLLQALPGDGWHATFKRPDGAVSTVVWSTLHGGQVLAAPTFSKLASLGGFAHTGRPYAVTRSTAGAVTDLESGAIFWSQAGGARWVPAGPMSSKAKQALSTAGYPVSDMYRADDRGSIVWTANATLYWADNTHAAYVLRGNIRSKFFEIGGLGRLGYPVSDSYAVGSTFRQDFQKGSIIWDPATATATVRYATPGLPTPV